MKCFPFADGNEVSASLVSGAFMAAQLAAGIDPNPTHLASLAKSKSKEHGQLHRIAMTVQRGPEHAMKVSVEGPSPAGLAHRMLLAEDQAPFPTHTLGSEYFEQRRLERAHIFAIY